MNLKQILSKKLNVKKEKLPKSFDQIGSISIIDIPDELKNYERIIGQELIRLHKNIKTVYKKGSARSGIYRTRKLNYLAGERTEITEHKEFGCKLRMNIRRCYFSPREGTERSRLIKQIRKGETIMVFFAGIGPYPILISRHTKAKNIIGIELNPVAVKYFRENAKINKAKNVSIIEGDVRKKAKEFYGLCDRVIMPLPETGYKYLEEAIKCLKKEGIINFYCFSPDDLSQIKEKIMRAGKRLNRKVKIIEQRKVLPYNAKISKWRIDIKVY